MVLGVLGVLDRTDCWLGFRVWGLPRRLLSVDELLAESRRAQHALPPKHMAVPPHTTWQRHLTWQPIRHGTSYIRALSSELCCDYTQRSLARDSRGRDE